MDDEVNWLDEQQLRSWMRLAALLVVLPGALDGEMQRRAGITQFEYSVLAGLSEAPGRTLRISTLAARMRKPRRGPRKTKSTEKPVSRTARSGRPGS